MEILGTLLLPLLFAAGPEPKHADHLMAFGRLAGEWKFTGKLHNDDGTETTDEGVIQIAWILGGRALQDIWKETLTSDGSPGTYGTTVRFYDPRIDAWRSVWLDPVTGSVRTFLGHETADGIVFKGVDGKGRSMRWIFSDVTPTTFRWHDERETKKGTWRTYEEMRAVRTR